MSPRAVKNQLLQLVANEINTGCFENVILNGSSTKMVHI